MAWIRSLDAHAPRSHLTRRMRERRGGMRNDGPVGGLHARREQRYTVAGVTGDRLRAETEFKRRIVGPGQEAELWLTSWAVALAAQVRAGTATCAEVADYNVQAAALFHINGQLYRQLRDIDADIVEPEPPPMFISAREAARVNRLPFVIDRDDWTITVVSGCEGRSGLVPTGMGMSLYFLSTYVGGGNLQGGIDETLGRLQGDFGIAMAAPAAAFAARRIFVQVVVAAFAAVLVYYAATKFIDWVFGPSSADLQRDYLRVTGTIAARREQVYKACVAAGKTQGECVKVANDLLPMPAPPDTVPGVITGLTKLAIVGGLLYGGYYLLRERRKRRRDAEE